MIPNNNLSVLPWYTSIDQQNARKWWIYDRVYPLFSPAGFLLPFQVIRSPLREQLANADEFNGYIRSNGATYDGGQDSVVEIFDVQGRDAIYLTNIPAPISVPGIETTRLAIYDASDNLLSILSTDNELYSGLLQLPSDAATIAVQTLNRNISEIYGYVSDPDAGPRQITEFEIYDYNTGQVVYYDGGDVRNAITIKPCPDYDVLVFPGLSYLIPNMRIGRYYAKMSDIENTWYSEVFTIIEDTQPYLKIEWWDNEDFVMDAGRIVYADNYGHPIFRNVLHLIADIAKPEYAFEEEGETRDGYFFPIKQISEKKYRFSFLASEYLLDVMRFIRMSDHIRITKDGQEYSVDTFLITPEWEDNGDVAAVDAEFNTATVAKKIGVGYIRAQRGDFNYDFNKDFNNQSNV